MTIPLERRKKGTWHVRQWKLHGEVWDLFCLNPAESPKKAADTLTAEVARAVDQRKASEPVEARKP